MFSWFLLNGLYFAIMYSALIEGDVGAARLFSLTTWVFAVGAMLASSNYDLRVKIQERGRSVPKFAANLTHLLIISALVYCGWWFTALAALFVAIGENSAFESSFNKEFSVDV